MPIQYLASNQARGIPKSNSTCSILENPHLAWHPIPVTILRPATPADIPEILLLERLPASQLYVGQWSEDRHRATLLSPDALYLVAGSPDGSLAAYAILRGLTEHSGSIELKRLVVSSPGQGLGRPILAEILHHAFTQLHAHRLFLDVYDDNPRARHLYQSLGFVHEGTMRDAGRRGDQYFPLHLLSLLDSEYLALHKSR